MKATFWRLLYRVTAWEWCYFRQRDAERERFYRHWKRSGWAPLPEVPEILANG